MYPIQVTFHGLASSDAVESACRKEAEKLAQFCDRITSCRIVVTAPHRQHRKGNLFAVRVDIGLPGGEVVVNREPPEHKEAEDIYLGLREAFHRARRQIEDHVRKHLRRDVKQHEELPAGIVAKLLPDYGFVKTTDDREIYFHRNAVQDEGFDALELGTPVEFREETGEKGPQARFVRVAGRPGSVLS